MSNAARYIKTTDPEAWIKERVVTKIGTKFITVASNMDNVIHEEKFDIKNNFSHHYNCGGQDYELYLSKEDICNDMRCESLYGQLQSLFKPWKNNSRFTLQQLEIVHETLVDVSSKDETAQ